MGVKAKLAVIVVMIVFLIITITAAEGGHTVTIEGKGDPHSVIYSGGGFHYWCDGANSRTCKITISVQ